MFSRSIKPRKSNSLRDREIYAYQHILPQKVNKVISDNVIFEYFTVVALNSLHAVKIAITRNGTFED